MKEENLKINPITLTDTESGTQYILEFNRESVKFAESKGFRMDDLENFPMTKIPELFYFAFRANHRNVSREKTDKLFDELGGMPDGMLERLGQLYALPFKSLVNKDDEERKNSKLKVEF